MEQKQQTPVGGRIRIIRGAEDQLAALERLWARGESSDPQADEDAWQALRQALNESRRAVGARPLFVDE
jgi:hypothetical protein